MRDARDVGRPPNIVRILGTCDDKLLVAQMTGRLDEQRFQRSLAVLSVGTEITESPARWNIGLGGRGKVGGAVESPRSGTAVDLLDDVQQRAAREREIQVEARNESGGNVGRLARIETRQ